ncbi:MAG: TrkA C-terminal domain-containing protein, partial [Firmicutes bacterium]|nr:TrkA C-terminal domain-containing protein [Candidatus Colivicinus equi]
DHTMFELKVQKNWVGHSLKELDLRNRFSINVIGVNREGNMNMNIDPDDKFKEDDVVLLVGPNDIFKKLSSINKL